MHHNNTRKNELAAGLLERATAIHEAGHAVMAYLLERPFKSVSAVEDEDSYGRVEHAMPGGWLRPDIAADDARTRRVIEDRVMIALAGAETEGAWFARLPDPPAGWQNHVSQGASYDRGIAADLAPYRSAGPEEWEAYLEWLRQRVLNHTGRGAGADGPVVTRFWTLVEALADAMQAARSLSWRRARAVLREADPYRRQQAALVAGDR